MNENFIKVDFEVLKIETLKNIGADGFMMYCFMLCNESKLSKTSISIEQFNDIGIKDKRTITKLLDKIINTDVINIITKIDEFKGKNKRNIEYKVKNIKQFVPLPVALIENEYKFIGSRGLLILTFLCRLHNSNFGGITSSGYANPTIEYLSHLSSMDKRTVMEYIKILIERKLIKCEKQEIVEVNNNGIIEKRKVANHYYIQHIVNNKGKYNTKKKKA